MESQRTARGAEEGGGVVRARCDVTKYWHWQALHTLGFVCVEDMSISHKSIKMTIFAIFALCGYRSEKRESLT